MDYNPFLPEVKENPYPYYAYLRSHAPVYRIESLRDLGEWWAVSRYDDVAYMLRTPELFSNARAMAVVTAGFDFIPQALVSLDPPDHTRQRKLVNKAFTPRLIASLESRTRALVDRLNTGLRSKKEFDLMDSFAVPLPAMVIADLLGAEPERWDDFKVWSLDMTLAMSGGLTDERRREIQRSLGALQTYVRGLIEARRRAPKDDLISALIRAEEEAQVLTEDEVFELALFVLYAGSETTTNLIGLALLALLNHPEQLAKVRANPSLVPNVVEEALRYDGPGQWFPRSTMRAVEMHGQTIPAGAIVMPIFASANRDERKFPDPDRFDVTRNTEGHLGFGHGIHFCLGSQLARLETRLALESLLYNCPEFARTDDPVVLTGGALIRGVKTLPLAFTAK